jgi:fatty acid-binding protein DegV
MPLLGIKEGKIEKAGLHLGTKDISEAMFKEIEARTKKLRKDNRRIRVVITHCDNLDGANKLKLKLKELKAEVSFINLVGPTIGAHVGPGSLIAAWTEIE